MTPKEIRAGMIRRGIKSNKDLLRRVEVAGVSISRQRMTRILSGDSIRDDELQVIKKILECDEVK